jgi:predicted transcriptional regulator
VTHLSIELPDELAAALARVAGDLGSMLEALLRDAAASIVEEEHDRLERIRQGRADAAAGRTVEHAEVVAWLRSWGTEDELPPPKCPD